MAVEGAPAPPLVWVGWEHGVESSAPTCSHAKLWAEYDLSQVAGGTSAQRSMESRAAGCCRAIHLSALCQQLPPGTASLKVCCLKGGDMWSHKREAALADEADCSVPSIGLPEGH